MKRILNKIYIFILAAALLVPVLCLSGCGYQPKKVEGEKWTYYIQKDGSAALIGLNPDAVPEDGVLYIPSTVDGHKVIGFGQHLGSSLVGGWVDKFQIPSMKKIIIAAGVPIHAGFWDSTARILEFESRTAEEIYFGSLRKNLIVPDGCLDVYIAAMEAQAQGQSKRYCIVEKSKVVDWYVDSDGLLRGYFGLETEHYVLPSGIKKIDGSSFGGGAPGKPKTIVLNEDLEEIGDYSFWFYPHSIDEIRIPQSVKSIGKYGVGSFKKVYLYRATTIDLYGIINTDNIIYLD